MHNLKSSNIFKSTSSRFLNLDRPIIALTGGIATGKSAASQMLINMGLPLIDADKLVKNIYSLNETISFIKSINEDFVDNNQINFKALRKAFFSDQKIKKEVEQYIYQELPHEFMRCYQKLNFNQYSFVIYDVPLLFEKSLESQFDRNILIYAPREVQKKRLIDRDQISDELAESILDQQLDIEEKKKKASLTIENDRDIKHLESELKSILTSLCE